jgi:hypothetical protein
MRVGYLANQSFVKVKYVREVPNEQQVSKSSVSRSEDGCDVDINAAGNGVSLL